MIKDLSQGFYRLPKVLDLIPISRSSWWAGVREGRFPQPVKLGKNTTAWRRHDIEMLIKTLENGGRDE